MTANHIRKAETLAKYFGAIELYKSGATLKEIGEKFGVTRQRINQILSQSGVKASDGGKFVSSAANRAANEEKRKSNKFSERHGLTKEEWLEAKNSGLLMAYRSQKRNAGTRGIQWLFAFKEWQAIWVDSGKLEQRGRFGDGYCMSRKNDDGPYAPWNVEIKTIRENSAEGFGRKVEKKNKGVFNLLKGRELSWLAKHGHKNIGWYASEEEAVSARDEYLRTHCLSDGKIPGGARGYTITKRGYFVAQCCGKSTHHKNAEDARASYLHMVSERIAQKEMAA